jgi:Protein of unknown function (DUF2961)
MAVLPSLMVWLALITAGEPTPGEGSGYRPSGSLDELTDAGQLARIRDPRIRPIVIGTKGSPGGLGGASGGSVVAEIEGPGIVQRIAFALPKDPPPTFKRSEIRLKVYLDGNPQPELVVSLEDLAAGRHLHFPRPLVGETDVELFSFVPIGFRNGCRLMLDGPHSSRCPVLVSGIALPDARGITSFRSDLTVDNRARLEKAVAIWSKPEGLYPADSGSNETSDFIVDGIALNSHRFLLPSGPRTIQSLEIEPAAGMDDAWRAARLKIQWENDEHAPDVDLPLGFAFARLPGVEPLQSLLMGTNGPAWSNRFPMPYRRQAFLQIESKTAIRGTIRVKTVRGVAPDAGYFHAAYREVTSVGETVASARPFAPGFPLSGRGHYAGALIAARFPAEGSTGTGSIRLVCPGLGTDLMLNGGPGPVAGWEASPTSGQFRGPTASGLRQAVGYRWHASDPITFVRPIDSAIEPHVEHQPATDVPVALAVFWYSEQPGSESVGP